MPDPSKTKPLLGTRVLMTVDAVGGVFTYALTLGKELLRRGASVHLATMGTAMIPAQRSAASAIGGLVVHESTFALEWMNEPWDDVARAGEWLLGLERTLAPDVVHLNGYCHAGIGFKAPVVVVGHSCVLSWWNAVLGETAPAEWDRYRREVQTGLLAANLVVTPTHAMMSCLERDYGALGARMVVPNGVPTPSPRRKRPGKERSVLAAGRLWDRAKNIEALARVARGFGGPVRVAGSDLLPDGSRKSLEGVENLGWLDDAALGRAMDAAAIFAHPARYAPFGLCPVEAAHRGCALVLGDIPSLREVWGDAALFVSPDDDDALASALERLAWDDALRQDYAARALARAATYTPARMADGYSAAYARVLAPASAITQEPIAKGEMLTCA